MAETIGPGRSAACVPRAGPVDSNESPRAQSRGASGPTTGTAPSHPAFIETTAAHRLIVRLAERAGTDEETARQSLMDSLGGIPIGRRGRAEEVAELSPSSLQSSRLDSRQRVRDRRPHCAGRLTLTPPGRRYPSQVPSP